MREPGCPFVLYARVLMLVLPTTLPGGQRGLLEDIEQQFMDSCCRAFAYPDFIDATLRARLCETSLPSFSSGMAPDTPCVGKVRFLSFCRFFGSPSLL